MPAPEITPKPLPDPAKGQSQEEFDNNIDTDLAWRRTNAAEIATFIDWMVLSRDEIVAAALTGNLPNLSGFAGRVPVVNESEDGLLLGRAPVFPDLVGQDGKLVTVDEANDGFKLSDRIASQGAWTPVVGTRAYNEAPDVTNAGRWNRIGDLVFCEFVLSLRDSAPVVQVNAVSGFGSEMVITGGFPFPFRDGEYLRDDEQMAAGSGYLENYSGGLMYAFGNIALRKASDGFGEQASLRWHTTAGNPVYNDCVIAGQFRYRTNPLPE